VVLAYLPAAGGGVLAQEALDGQLVAEVGEGAGLAVLGGGEGGPAGGCEVRPVQPHGPKLAVQAGDLGCEDRYVRQGVVYLLPQASQSGHGPGESGDDAAGVAVPGCGLLKIGSAGRVRIGH
jgi:hypothetical protein